jgi:GT2 family glycosyltransferase
MTSTAVVILNYNGEKLLKQFLPSVVAHSQGAAVIVADNGSTDQSIKILKTEFPSVKIIALDKNYGFCGGYNKVLQQLKASYYVLLNSDVEVTQGWLDPLVDLLDQNANVAAVQPKILSYHDRKKFEYAGAAGGFIDALGYPFCRGRILSTVEEDTGQYNDEREIFWATGACFMIRSEVYHRFNGLDEDLFAHMEEIDLCWKMIRASHKIYFSGKSTVYHLGAGTLGYERAQKTYLNFRNGLILIFKHLDGSELVYKIPFRIILDWIAAFMFLLKGKFNNAGSILKAHFHFLRDLGAHRTKRREIQKTHPSYSRTNVYSGLILFDYYLRNRKTFSNPR